MMRGNLPIFTQSSSVSKCALQFSLNNIFQLLKWKMTSHGICLYAFPLVQVLNLFFELASKEAMMVPFGKLQISV